MTGLSTVLLASCGQTVESPVPRWQVYYELSPQQTEYRELLAPGGIVLLRESPIASMPLPPLGIAVVRSFTTADYYAYDLACSVEANPRSQLMRAGLQLRCPRCGSTFDILSGTGIPTSGVAKYPLRTYRASLTGRGTILVTN